MTNLLREFRYAARTLARWRGGLPLAVLTLAIGVGTATALTAVARIIVAAFPLVPEVADVGRIYAASQSMGVVRAPVAAHEFASTLSAARSFAASGAYAQATVTAGRGDASEDVIAGFASPGFFQVLAVPPALGRVISSDDLQAARPVAVVSDRLWRSRFPSANLDSATIAINGIDHTVVGVMPAPFSYPLAGVTADVWLPLGPDARDVSFIVSVFARLRSGVSWTAADAELRTLPSASPGWTWRAIPLAADARRRDRFAYAATSVPALIVLLMACVNVACLLLARGLARQPEAAVRRALGASRRQLARELFTEHALLALAGGGLGWLLARGLLGIVRLSLAAVQPGAALRVPTDLTTLPLALALAMLATVLFGILPALRWARTDVIGPLAGRSRAGVLNFSDYGPRDLVVFAEVGTAVGLAVFAAMTFNLFRSIAFVRPAFDADHVVAVWVPPDAVATLARRVADVPGVERVAISSGSLGGFGRAAVPAHSSSGGAARISRVPVGDGFLPTLGVPMLRGRSFSAAETRAHAHVAVLSESAARSLFGDTDPLGASVTFAGHDSASVQVIGISRDAVDYGALGRAGLVAPDAYVPFEQNGSDPVVLARVRGDGRTFLRAIEAAAQPRPGLRPPKARRLSDETAMPGTAGSDVMVTLLALLGGLALLLAACGVVAVVSQSVAQRTREFGIRLAIGATPAGLLRMVLGREARLVGAALASGAAITFLLTRVAFRELAALSATSSVVWFVLMVICGGVATLACLVATWRIVRLEPAAVLRRP